MLRFSDKRTAWWTVTINAPEGDVDVTVKYHLLDRDEMAGYLRKNIAKSKEAGASPTEALLTALDAEVMATSDEFLIPRVLDWKEGDFGEADGSLMACNPDNLRRLFKAPYIREAIDKGLWEASRGARAKN